jgi:hypothetical protein
MSHPLGCQAAVSVSTFEKVEGLGGIAIFTWWILGISAFSMTNQDNPKMRRRTLYQFVAPVPRFRLQSAYLKLWRFNSVYSIFSLQKIAYTSVYLSPQKLI